LTHPLKRRPTAVRVVVPDEFRDHPTRDQDDHDHEAQTRHASLNGKTTRSQANERTPLIKAGVKPDYRKSVDETQAMAVMRRAEVGLGRMVELGLPLIMCVDGAAA
jgi:putative membrane protein